MVESWIVDGCASHELIKTNNNKRLNDLEKMETQL